MGCLVDEARVEVDRATAETTNDSLKKSLLCIYENPSVLIIYFIIKTDYDIIG